MVVKFSGSGRCCSNIRRTKDCWFGTIFVESIRNYNLEHYYSCANSAEIYKNIKGVNEDVIFSEARQNGSTTICTNANFCKSYICL